MIYLKENISIFGLVAFSAFLFTSLENSNEIAKALTFSLTGNASAQLNLPYKSFFITVPLFIVASRLYIHGWLVDETFLMFRIRHLDQPPNRFLVKFERFLRFFWITLTAFLPSILAKSYFEIFSIAISWDLYLAILILTLIMWDFTFKKYILEVSKIKSLTKEENMKMVVHLNYIWFYADIFLLVVCVLNFIASNFIFNDWKHIIFFIFLSFTVTICLFQIFWFLPELFKSRIKFNYYRK